MKVLVLVCCVISLCSCADGEPEVKDLRDDVSEESVSEERVSESASQEVNEAEGEEKMNSEWTYEVIFISEKNWGYQLFQNGTMKINQTSIPSVQGIAGFDSQEKAERTAKYILGKLEKGVFPPTVDKKELDSLNVLRD